MNAGPEMRLRLLDLDALDARELRRLLPHGSYNLEQEQLPRDEHGDLGITATVVVLLTPLVIQAVGAWLLKKRQRRSFVLTVEKIAPDNTTQRISLNIAESGSEASQQDALKQLISGMQLDPSVVDAITGGST